MSKKCLLTIIISTIVIIGICYIASIFPQYNGGEVSRFETYRADFEKINKYLIETYSEMTAEDLYTVFLKQNAFQIVEWQDDKKTNLDENFTAELTAVIPAFDGYDFSFIKISNDRISYCGEGCRMYVYSRDGEAPTYYYHKDDEMSPEVYELGDNWYLLKVYFR